MATDTETGDSFPATPEGTPPPVKAILRWLRAIWTLLASILAIVTVLNALVPKLYGPDAPFRTLIDFLFDAPSAERQAAGRADLPKQISTGAGGYVYYEVSADAQPTSDGRLMPIAGPMPTFGQIAPKSVFKTIDQIRLRAAPTSNSQLLSILDANVCVQVSPGSPTPVTVSSAASGGWLPVTRIPCPNPLTAG